MNKISLLQIYSEKSSSWIYDATTNDLREIVISTGVRQGDPLGPALYALSDMALLRLKNDLIDLNGTLMAYLDDEALIVDHDTGLKYVHLSVTEGPQYGAVLNPEKTVILLGKCSSYREAMSRKRAYAEALGIEPTGSLIHIHPDNSTGHEGSPLKELHAERYGKELLGVPIGSTRFVEKWLDDKLLSLKKEAEMILKFPDKQAQFVFLRLVLCNKINHIIRALYPSETKKFVSDFQLIIKDVFCDIMDLDEISDIQWLQVCLPCDAGGFGLPQFADVADCAFLASFLSCWESCHRAIEIYPDLLKTAASHRSLHEINAATNRFSLVDDGLLQKINVCKEDGKILWDTIHEQGLEKRYKFQAELNEKWSNHHTLNLRAGLSTVRDSTRINSAATSESGAFLRVCCLSVTRKMSNNQFVIACHMRLGLPLHITQGLLNCDCRKEARIDEQGDHFFACPRGNHRQQSHNALNQLLSELAYAAGVRNKTEPTGLFQLAHDSNKRPDLLLYSPKIKTKEHPEGWPHNIIVDTSLTHPLLPSHLPKSMVTKEQKSLPAIEKREIEKQNKYSSLALQNNLAFIPAVVDCIGAWGSHFKLLMRELVHKAHGRRGISKSVLLEYWSQRISVCIQSYITSMLISRCDRLYDLTYVPYDESNYAANIAVEPSF